MMNSEKLKNELVDAILNEKLERGSLTEPVNMCTKGSCSHPLKETIRPLIIRGVFHYQVTSHFSQKVLHRNLNAKECSDFIQASLPTVYKQGVFECTSTYYHILTTKDAEVKVIKKNTHLKKSQPIPLHNRNKIYVLQEGTPIPFLEELGIMKENGQVIAKKYDKFKQINKFIEIVADILPHLPKNSPIEIVDFGCGKASLTFALYHYLHHIEHRQVHITGYDLKADVIASCQALANKLKFSSLKFVLGDINDHIPAKKVHLMVSLHACDTATDAALEKAIGWETDVVLCIPCCQHELFKQIKNENLNSILRRGILKERFAALATDAARAEILESIGYDVDIMEFIDLEHTPKNLLIRGVRNPSCSRSQAAKKRYLQFKQALHITPSLETRFPTLFA